MSGTGIILNTGHTTLAAYYRILLSVIVIMVNKPTVESIPRVSLHNFLITTSGNC